MATPPRSIFTDCAQSQSPSAIEQSMRSEIELYRRRIAQLEQSCAEGRQAQANLVGTTTELQAVRRLLEDVRSEKEQLQQQIQILQQQLQQQQSLSPQTQSNRQEIASLNRRLETALLLANDVHRLVAEKQHLQTQLESTREQLTRAQSQPTVCHLHVEQIAQLQQTNQALQQQLDQQQIVVDQVQQNQAIVAQLQQQIGSVAEQNVTLKTQLQQFQNASITDSIERNRIQIQLDETLLEYQRLVETRANDLRTQQESTRQYDLQVHNLHLQLQEVQGLLSNSDQTTAAFTTQTERLQNQLRDAQRQNDSLLEQLHTQRQQTFTDPNQDLRRELERVRSSELAARMQSQEDREARDQAEIQVNHLTQQIQTYRRRQYEADQRVAMQLQNQEQVQLDQQPIQQLLDEQARASQRIIQDLQAEVRVLRECLTQIDENAALLAALDD